MAKEGSAEAPIRDSNGKTRRKYTTEEKIRIVIEGLRGEQSIAALGRREGIAERLYDSGSQEFMEAGNSQCQANSSEVEDLRQANEPLKPLGAERARQNRVLKKSGAGAASEWDA